MARYPRSSTLTKLSVSSTIASSSLKYASNSNSHSSYHNQYPPKTRGSMLAQEFFSTYDNEDSVEECSDEYESTYYKTVDDEPYRWPQIELPLETTEELNQRLRNDINRFENAYDKMVLSAVRWKQLMEDVEKNPQIKKMFKDLQLVRKLSGSDME